VQQLGSRYFLDAPIGRGSFGQVWRAHDRADRPFAVKILRPDLAGEPEVVSRFVRERTMVVGLSSPHLVGVYDFVVEGDTLAIVMELVDGHDLRQELREKGPLSPTEALRTSAAVCRGLAVVHARGIVHRDIKPGNVLLDPSHGRVTPKLTDFGVGWLYEDARVTSTSSLVGTPEYMAPEYAMGGAVTPQVDVYAVGIMLYELVCGVTPFVGGNPMAVLNRHISRAAVKPESMHPAVWELVEQLIAKDPLERPTASVAAMAMAQLAEHLVNEEAAPAITGVPATATANFKLPSEEDDGSNVIQPVLLGDVVDEYGSATIIRERPAPALDAAEDENGTILRLPIHDSERSEGKDAPRDSLSPVPIVGVPALIGRPEFEQATTSSTSAGSLEGSESPTDVVPRPPALDQTVFRDMPLVTHVPSADRPWSDFTKEVSEASAPAADEESLTQELLNQSGSDVVAATPIGDGRQRPRRKTVMMLAAAVVAVLVSAGVTAVALTGGSTAEAVGFPPAAAASSVPTATVSAESPTIEASVGASPVAATAAESAITPISEVPSAAVSPSSVPNGGVGSRTTPTPAQGASGQPTGSNIGPASTSSPVALPPPPPPLTIDTSALPAATQGIQYQQPLAASSSGTLKWSLQGGSLPAGIALGGSALSGRPTVPGDYSFVLKVDNGTVSATRPFALTVTRAPGPIIDTRLEPGVVDIDYNAPLVATGTAPFSWSLAGGALPPGLNISGSVISGEPSQAGRFGFGLRVTDGNGNSADQAFSIQVADTPRITTDGLPGGQQETAYPETTIQGSGTGTLEWSVADGALPQGLAFNNGTITGTPESAGDSRFTVKLKDDVAETTKEFTITIAAPPEQPPADPPQ
jgi:serine/threonine protein kinase